MPTTAFGAGPEGPTAFPDDLQFQAGVDRVSGLQTFVLTDAGATINILSFNLTNAEFQVVRDNCPGTPFATSGTSCTVSVQFDPWAAGPVRSTLTITTTTGTVPVLLIGTTAAGTQRAEAMGNLSSAGLFLDELVCLAFLLFLAIVAAASWRDLSSRTRPRSAGQLGTALGSPVLASDAEREVTARTVADAIAEGRLDLDEGTERIDAVFGARHCHELVQLVADLPTWERPSRGRLVRWLPTCTAVVSLAALLAQGLAGVWELWPVIVAALAVVAGQRLKRR